MYEKLNGLSKEELIEKYKKILVENRKLYDVINDYKYDFLTGLKMRKDFIEDMESLKLEHESSLYVTFFDINNLHNINREMGYLYGDLVIKDTVNDIQSLCKSFGHTYLFYRIGGDEFILIHDIELDFSKIENVTYSTLPLNKYEDTEDLLSELDRLNIEKKKLLRRRSIDR